MKAYSDVKNKDGRYWFVEPPEYYSPDNWYEISKELYELLQVHFKQRGTLKGVKGAPMDDEDGGDMFTFSDYGEVDDV